MDWIQPKLPAQVQADVQAWRSGAGERLGLRYFVYDWSINDASGDGSTE